jgi:ion channel-forming bestrophin family protein
MYTGRVIPLKIIIQFAWRAWLVYLLYSFAIVGLYTWGGITCLAIPFLPISLIGTAVALYVGFKNNSSYERLWEARRIWGGVVNTSRTFGIFIMDYLQPSSSISAHDLQKMKRRLIYRHLGYINALRIQLRGKKVWEEENANIAVVRKFTDFHEENLLHELAKFLSEEEIETYKHKQNIATQILAKQSSEVSLAQKLLVVDDFRHMEFGKVFTELYNLQGACERIKTFPFPRQYAFFSRVFVYVFIAVLPFGLLNEFSKLEGNLIWLTIPFFMVVAWIFFTMEEVGDTSENPFENGINDVPMTAICRNIEIDLLQMLGEKNIPERIMPQNKILM